MNSLICKGIIFKEIEKEFFEIGCEIARNLMEDFLSKADKELAESRDKSQLRHKGSRKTTVKTLMGEVKYKRTMYKKVKEDGSKEYIYLLDEALRFNTIGLISPNIVEKILENSCEMSYRGVAKAVSELTNQNISHQGVWDIVQVAGEKQIEIEKQKIKKFERNELCGEKEVPVLFEEADGLWLSMQGKSRKGSSKGKKELKIGVVYEGWEKRYPSSKEYKTVEKTAFAGYAKIDEFKQIREAEIAEKYNTDKIEYRILNGDGASWIRNGHDLETDIFQLDPYHLSQSVIRNVYDKKARRHIIRWLKAGEIEKVFSKIEKLKYECGGVEKEIKKLETLEKYIKRNIDGIVVYKNREGIKLPKAPKGIEYRTLGTMERNVNIFAKRMKGAKSWSQKGATNLSKIIALKMGKGFKEKIAALISDKVSERLVERFEENIRNNRLEIKKAAKKYIYPLHQGEIPFTDCKVTNGRKAIRAMFNYRSFNELKYK